MILKIHYSLIIALLYNLFYKKQKIYFIAYMFIIMHELTHMIIALLLNVDIEEINLTLFGANAKYSGKINTIKDLIISISGPLASSFFCFIYNNNTYFVINIMILIFNIIPIYPLDGGRIARDLLTMILDEERRTTNRILYKYNGYFINVILFNIYVNKIQELYTCDNGYVYY